MRSKITGTGSYLPEKILDNFQLEKMVDTSDEWITERTGIKERRIAGTDEATSDLCLKASKRALRSAGLKPSDLDMIIVTTMSGDMPMPSTASILQGKLGAKNAAAFDLNAACSGFLYGLSVADSFITSRKSSRLLLVSGEINSRFINWEDRSTCVIFADGAGAVVLEPESGKRGIISTRLYSNGELWDLITLPGGGSKHPIREANINSKLHFIHMKGNETFRVAVKTLERLVTDTLHADGLKPSQLSLLIPHQANIRIINATAERLGLPMEKVFVNLQKYGNTSSASIPIAIDEALKAGRINEGDYVLLEAFGSGLTWASALIKW
ncbi:MAG: ketoacyl-ACP synthase III [Nitrospirae bacterium]|nr:ketoacyl-ACP synthase III [Nitrospirota bacterium]